MNKEFRWFYSTRKQKQNMKAVATRSQQVLLAKLAESPIQSRLRSAGIEALATNMGLHGQLTPIVVTSQGAPPGSYFIVDGHHRALAAKLLRWSSISCVVEDIHPEVSYFAIAMSTQRFTDRHGFESWARSANPDMLLLSITRKAFVRDVEMFVQIVGEARARDIALSGKASPGWARHARTVYNAIQERTTGELARNASRKIPKRASSITEAQVLEWMIKQGSSAAMNLHKAIDLTAHLTEFANRILRDEPFPQKDWR